MAVEAGPFQLVPTLIRSILLFQLVFIKYRKKTPKLKNEVSRKLLKLKNRDWYGIIPLAVDEDNWFVEINNMGLGPK